MSMDALAQLKTQCRLVAAKAGQTLHAANMVNTSPGSTAAEGWLERKRAELHQAEDDLYALLEARRKARS